MTCSAVAQPAARRENSTPRPPPTAKATRSPTLQPAESAQLQPPVEKQPPPAEAAEADHRRQEEASAKEEEEKEADPRTPRQTHRRSRGQQLHDPAFGRARPRQHKQQQSCTLPKAPSRRDTVGRPANLRRRATRAVETIWPREHKQPHRSRPTGHDNF